MHNKNHIIKHEIQHHINQSEFELLRVIGARKQLQCQKNTLILEKE